MKILLLFLTSSVLTYVSVKARSVEDAKYGCTAPFFLPNLPYMVVWDVPSSGCEYSGHKLNLPAYRFVENKNDSFYGKNIITFYGLGEWPLFAGANHTPVNGGIPQLGNLTLHLEAVQEQIDKYLPDPNSAGMGVVDMEAWRPHLQMNWDARYIYENRSYELVKKQNPTWRNWNLIVAEATRQFDSAAKAFIQKTLEVARHLRPNGYWGFYGYPCCWGQTIETLCSPASQEVNDIYLWWMYSTANGLHPSIYTSRHTPLKQRQTVIRKVVNETLRIQVRWSGLKATVMPYTLIQNSGTDFFQKEDLQVAIQEPADVGASGVIIWGSTAIFHTPNECELLKNYIKNILGPFVKNLTDFSQSCAQDLCHNHGRCVSKAYEAQTQEFLRLNQKTSCVRPREEYEDIASRRQVQFGENASVRKYDNYICRCLAGWHGEYCDKRP